MTGINKICVFCGHNIGKQAEYQQATIVFARQLVQQNYRLVYGGSKTGLMGILADSVLAQGGDVVGVFPRFLDEREKHHPGVTQMIFVDNMAERKQKMIELADAFVMLPGGMGSLDEFTQVFTLTQIGKSQKPMGILNVKGYYDPWLQMMNHMVEQGFAGKEQASWYVAAEDPMTLLEQLQQVRICYNK